ncbi:hypothetical protein ND861_16810 [Leptospira sp. 2 VSF19]|uniref:Uncharacterized protein n=1 Tax=Leptospira soteropolitanensis TaxID=2950025 RepID=A0AAW5VH79_9LEPT|nr:hypothetical protein [Leptospira soteropolitanensis]MCW7494310.1 hypothetical protein [Leptospira soteropolitanensis]MCW7501981.1 hypothetical protein [Leptospira soteropolitanensis]MCW7524156.1 hypothetical protein [Leptospira soteropolitanensis]MCW7528021.1 hypothetical protein [Leptospira soteropolitanensis]MCW7531875.1 hypothetical protein [Leptospira soteropolitanensis]
MKIFSYLSICFTRFLVIVLLSFTYPLLANFLVTPEQNLRLELVGSSRDQIRFCKQKPIQVFGRNPVTSSGTCQFLPEAEVSLDHFFTEELADTEETQWAFYDGSGKQLFPTVTWEGQETLNFISVVRSKRGQFGMQLQRKRDEAYFFYRTKIQNWVI